LRAAPRISCPSRTRSPPSRARFAPSRISAGADESLTFQ
jgi:hypothetical protein